MQLGKTKFILERFFEADNSDEYSDTFVKKNSLNFINGLALAKSRPRIVVPLLIAFAFETLMFLSVLADNIIHFTDVNWFMKMIDYTFSFVNMVFIFIMVAYNSEILELNKEIDNWWAYTLLDNETKKMKKKTRLWLSQFDAYYYYFMRVGSVAYILMPIGKFIYNGYSNTGDLLLYYSWAPFTIQRTWGFILYYLFQLITVYISFFSFTCVSSYLLTATVTIGFQMQLIGQAFLTMEERALKMMEVATLSPYIGSWEKLYEETLLGEIKSCALNYQNLYWVSKKLFKVFSLVPTFCFYSGMCLMVFCSVKLVSTNVNNYIRIQAFIMVCAVLLNQYLYSLINENLTEEVEKLRFTIYRSSWYTMPVSCQKSVYLMQTMLLYAPTLTTMLGANTNFEFFSKVVNASYYYISMILSMNSRYGNF